MLGSKKWILCMGLFVVDVISFMAIILVILGVILIFIWLGIVVIILVLF